MTEQVEAFDGPPTAGWRQAHKGTLWPCRPWSACGAAPTNQVAKKRAWQPWIHIVE